MLNEPLFDRLVEERSQITQIGGDGTLRVAQLYETVRFEVPQEAHSELVEVQWLAGKGSELTEGGFEPSVASDVAALLQTCDIAVRKGEEVGSPFSCKPLI